VDTSEAGLGDVDVTVTCSSGHVDVKRHNVDEFRQKFTFVPSLSIKHDVSVTFNKQHVTGGLPDDVQFISCLLSVFYFVLFFNYCISVFVLLCFCALYFVLYW